MFKIAKPFYIRTISSLHAGSGNDLGIVDLPIQREKHTDFPKIESSSLKGSLREAFENKKNIPYQEVQKLFKLNELKSEDTEYNYALHLIFGYDKDAANDNINKKFDDNTEFSGCISFTDARLLFFPVKSAKGIFALITCPYILKRLIEDFSLIGESDYFKFSEDKIDTGNCLVSDNSNVSIQDNVILEEYSFKIIKNNSLDILNNLIKDFNIKEKLVVLSDDDFKDFVNFSTEVISRTKINNERGTVETGALFNEEYLPPETIMYYLVFANSIFHKDELKGIFKNNWDDNIAEEEKVFEFFKKGLPEYMQIGGNVTLGKGIVKTGIFELKNLK